MSINSENREIYGKALRLAIPMMIQSGITNAVGLVDNLMVGSLGTESITAVSIVGQLIFVFNLSIFGGLSGPGIYGAQYYGQGNKEGFHNVFRLKVWISIFALLAGLLIFSFGGQQLVSLYIHGSDSTIDTTLTMKLAQEYMEIMLWGFVPFVITQIYAGSLRETGESIKPMVGGIASVVVDVVFNYLLIYGHFGFPKLGVRGAALAAVLARIVEMTIVVVWTNVQISKHEFLRGALRTLRIPLFDMKIIILKSLPIFINEFLWAGGMAALTQCYSMRGINIVPGLNISNAICNLLNVVFVAMGNAVGILSGQYLGASQFDKAKRYSVKLMWFTGGLCLILTAILLALSGVFPLLYDTTEDVRQLGKNFIRINSLFFPVQGFLNALYFTLRSGGKTVITFLFDSVYTWVVCVVLAFILCSFTSIPILIVFALVQSMDIIKLFIGYTLIRKGVWITNLVEAEA